MGWSCLGGVVTRVAYQQFEVLLFGTKDACCCRSPCTIQEYESACADIEMAQQIEPSPELQKLKLKLHRQLEQQRKREQQIYRNMFGGLSPLLLLERPSLFLSSGYRQSAGRMYCVKRGCVKPDWGGGGCGSQFSAVFRSFSQFPENFLRKFLPTATFLPKSDFHFGKKILIL